MKHHAPSSIAAALLACTLCARPALAKLTEVSLDDKQMTFAWTVTWDGELAAASLNRSTLKYWDAVFSISALDGDTANDLDVTLFHRGLGPKEAEGKAHGDGGIYRFKAMDIDTRLKQLTPPRTQNIEGSIQRLPHLGEGVRHRDDIRLEFKKIGKEVTFQLIGVHVDAPVPEPAAWALVAAGLGMLPGALRARRARDQA